MENKKEVVVETQTLNKVSNVKTPEILDLLKAGCHFGHKKSAWNPRMKQYIYEERNGIHIIDLVKTQELITATIKALSELTEKGNILFVGTKGQAASIVEKVATENGAFYVNKRWPGGLFTNFDTIKKSVQGLVKMEESLARGGEDLVKKERLFMQRESEKMDRIYKGIKFMDKLPAAVVVVDSKVEKLAIKEAKIAHIPIIALIDTNCNPDLVDYPIPANDDSLKSISLLVEILGQVVGESKKSQGIVALRNSQKATLETLAKQYAEQKERSARMEEEDRERMKSLREGKVAESKGTVVRVVKKDISGEIAAAEEAKKIVDSKSVEDLGLSVRIVKALAENGIKNVSDLSGKTKEDLVEIKGVGEKAAVDILKSLK
ncbi:MAG: 30S ribosomal protein S2 [candidate division WS6 bacterium GW2011_GWC2_36_7]|uniref:Small ribosomal subunit protein uS2 n=1 Tax=candidate division WS6 bacterium GW2011_GWC2_36_7 TaxID=1619091 RepID=A0A0G0I6L5_9BACT|nr:MAG: 30S ribosomal protein S2 [candidate division WS6 bacterium GW2011_GWC2_36_7]